jgi:hypothetical protein
VPRPAIRSAARIALAIEATTSVTIRAASNPFEEDSSSFTFAPAKRTRSAASLTPHAAQPAAKRGRA